MTPDCRCDPPVGASLIYCERHKCEKTRVLWDMCQQRGRMWTAWEEGRGPGQGTRKPRIVKVTAKKSCCGAVAMAWDLAKSLAAFAADGFRTVDSNEYQRRLAICDGCKERDESRCSVCGCYVAAKAKGRVWHCPLEKW